MPGHQREPGDVSQVEGEVWWPERLRGQAPETARRVERQSQTHRCRSGDRPGRPPGLGLKKLVKPAARKKAMELLQEKHSFWQRRACQLTQCNRKPVQSLQTRRGWAAAPQAINEVWTMDFTSDRLCDGRSCRTLNIIGIFTRRCLGIEIDTSLSRRGACPGASHPAVWQASAASNR